LQLLTIKPVIYVDEAGIRQQRQSRGRPRARGSKVPELVSATIEEQIADMEDAGKIPRQYGLTESGLVSKLIRASYELNLITYFTAVREVRGYPTRERQKPPRPAIITPVRAVRSSSCR
jgi:ribosome-binding ATPase YchF (GTP1/OBG family)